MALQANIIRKHVPLTNKIICKSNKDKISRVVYKVPLWDPLCGAGGG